MSKTETKTTRTKTLMAAGFGALALGTMALAAPATVDSKPIEYVNPTSIPATGAHRSAQGLGDVVHDLHTRLFSAPQVELAANAPERGALASNDLRRSFDLRAGFRSSR